MRENNPTRLAAILLQNEEAKDTKILLISKNTQESPNKVCFANAFVIIKGQI